MNECKTETDLQILRREEKGERKRKDSTLRPLGLSVGRPRNGLDGLRINGRVIKTRVTTLTSDSKIEKESSAGVPVQSVSRASMTSLAPPCEQSQKTEAEVIQKVESAAAETKYVKGLSMQFPGPGRVAAILEAAQAEVDANEIQSSPPALGRPPPPLRIDPLLTPRSPLMTANLEEGKGGLPVPGTFRPVPPQAPRPAALTAFRPFGAGGEVREHTLSGDMAFAYYNASLDTTWRAFVANGMSGRSDFYAAVVPVVLVDEKGQTSVAPFLLSLSRMKILSYFKQPSVSVPYIPLAQVRGASDAKLQLTSNLYFSTNISSPAALRYAEIFERLISEYQRQKTWYVTLQHLSPTPDNSITIDGPSGTLAFYLMCADIPVPFAVAGEVDLTSTSVRLLPVGMSVEKATFLANEGWSVLVPYEDEQQALVLAQHNIFTVTAALSDPGARKISRSYLVSSIGDVITAGLLKTWLVPVTFAPKHVAEQNLEQHKQDMPEAMYKNLVAALKKIGPDDNAINQIVSIAQKAASPPKNTPQEDTKLLEGVRGLLQQLYDGEKVTDSYRTHSSMLTSQEIRDAEVAKLKTIYGIVWSDHPGTRAQVAEKHKSFLQNILFRTPAASRAQKKARRRARHGEQAGPSQTAPRAAGRGTVIPDNYFM